MRLKRSNPRACVCALVSFVVLSVMAFTAVSAFALNPERHYEMVSPPYKGGYGVLNMEGAAQDGESLAFYSPGTFAGAPGGVSEALDTVRYLAHREAGRGWTTVPMVPPDALSSTLNGSADLSPTLGTELEGVRLENLEDPTQEPNRFEFALHATGAPDVSTEWGALGGMVLETTAKTPLVLAYRGASPDFCHVLFNNLEESGPGTETQALAQAHPAAKGAKQPLYELNRGCNGEPVELRLVAVDNEGEGKVISPSCNPELGSNNYSQPSTAFNAIAAGGTEIFFTTCIANEPLHHQLFVRLGGVRTLEVSKPVGECAKVPCKGALERANADFVGASQSGTSVFFTAPLAAGQAPLVPGTTDSSDNLYMAGLGCPEGRAECEVSERAVVSLVQASHDPTAGQAAEVQGVLRVAPDGSRAYFVARGILSEGLNAHGASPVKGADNLYVYERDAAYPAGHVAFVGDLCSGPVGSGEVEDVRCPSQTGSDKKLWAGPLGSAVADAAFEAQTAGGDGRYLVFSSYAQLVASDTDTARDVYRYDAQTGLLDRVSHGQAGYHSNGNDNSFNASIALTEPQASQVKIQDESYTRAVSEDGSRIVFTTSEPLSPSAINGLPDVYEWHEQPGGGEGSVSLISSGSSETPDRGAVISPSGRDVFFITSQGLVPQDTDGAPDVYDARLGEGFPEPPAPRQQCSSDACQGALTNPAPLLVPGSVPQPPGGNFAAPVFTTTVKPKSKAKPARCRKGYVKKKGKCVKKPKKPAKGKK